MTMSRDDATVPIDRIVTAHAVLRTAVLAHAPRRATLACGGVLCRGGPHPQDCACGELFYCARIQAAQALHALLACTRSHPHPLKGLWRARQHNAERIMRSTRSCAVRLQRPHNLRYVCMPAVRVLAHS